MKQTIAEVRADVSAFDNKYFADLTTSAGVRLGWFSLKTMLAYFSEKICRKYFPFIPDKLKFNLKHSPILLEPENSFRFTLNLENDTEWDVQSSVLGFELFVSSEQIFVWEKPLMLQLKQRGQEEIEVIIYLTPGVTSKLKQTLESKREPECLLKFHLPVEHLLGREIITQKVATILKIRNA